VPRGASYAQLYGVALPCGIGFTMSLFIGGLAWEHADFEDPVRLGVLTGSLLAGVGGYLVLLATSSARSALPSGERRPANHGGRLDGSGGTGPRPRAFA
jgi:NhaA family Na+:H+ antiporter